MRGTGMPRTEPWRLRAAALGVTLVAVVRPARADDATLLDHPAPWWLSGQLNAIGQAAAIVGRSSALRWCVNGGSSDRAARAPSGSL